MGKVIINVGWNGNYSASPENKDICVVVTGNTLDEVKKNMMQSLCAHIDAMKKDGEIIPPEFKGEFDFEFHLNVRAILHFTDGIITKTALAKETGINVKQLTHYASGWRNPRPETSKKIFDGIKQISQKLISVSL